MPALEVVGARVFNRFIPGEIIRLIELNKLGNLSKLEVQVLDKLRAFCAADFLPGNVSNSLISCGEMRFVIAPNMSSKFFVSGEFVVSINEDSEIDFAPRYQTVGYYIKKYMPLTASAIRQKYETLTGNDKKMLEELLGCPLQSLADSERVSFQLLQFGFVRSNVVQHSQHTLALTREATSIKSRRGSHVIF